MSHAIKSIGFEINDSFRRYFVRNVENLKYLSKLNPFNYFVVTMATIL